MAVGRSCRSSTRHSRLEDHLRRHRGALDHRERLRRVREHLGSDEMFLANYSDGLSDLDLAEHVRDVPKRNKVASFLSVPAPHTFHIVRRRGPPRHASSRPSAHRSSGSTEASSSCAARSSIHAARRGPRPRAVRAAHREAAADRRPVRRLLAQHGHVQGQDDLDELWGQGKAPWKIWRRG